MVETENNNNTGNQEQLGKKADQGPGMEQLDIFNQEGQDEKPFPIKRIVCTSCGINIFYEWTQAETAEFIFCHLCGEKQFLELDLERLRHEVRILRAENAALKRGLEMATRQREKNPDQDTHGQEIEKLKSQLYSMTQSRKGARGIACSLRNKYEPEKRLPWDQVQKKRTRRRKNVE